MNIRISAIVSVSLLFIVTVAHALSPLPPKTLEERVILATHVFVGKIIEAQEFPSDKPTMRFGHVIYTVKLENLIWPQEGWYSHKPITIRGILGFDFGDEGVIGQSRIFIISQDANDGSVFQSPCGRETSVSVKEMPNVIRAIYKKKKIKNEPNQAMQTTPVADL
jgi:hypothetical protein